MKASFTAGFRGEVRKALRQFAEGKRSKKKGLETSNAVPSATLVRRHSLRFLLALA